MSPAFCEHPARFLQTRYRCEWCDRDVEPGGVTCEDCSRKELDRQLEEDG